MFRYAADMFTYAAVMFTSDDVSTDAYGSLSVHRLMLSDKTRTTTYQRAITRVVKPGDSVIDMGAGTGILSMFAAISGAKIVYAIERSPISHFAKTLIAANGLDDKITVIGSDVRQVTLPEKVDVIVSEWMGVFGNDDDMLQPLLVARDRWLKPDGRLIPERVRILLAPIWEPALHREIRFWRSRLFGVDLGPIAERTTNEVVGRHHSLSMRNVMAEPICLADIDLHTFEASKAERAMHASCTFETSRAGKVNALAAWFEADFGCGTMLTNGPSAPRTHWGVARFPLYQTVALKHGSKISVQFAFIPDGKGAKYCEWCVQVDDSPWEYHTSAPMSGAV